MPETNPLPDAALEELERSITALGLHQHAIELDGKGDGWIRPDGDAELGNWRVARFAWASDAKAALYVVSNAYALIARLRTAEAERDGLARELGVTRSAVRSPELFQAIHESLAPAARDARIKREGAIEALEEIANLIRQTTPDARSASNVERGKFEGRMYAIEQIESEAAKLRGGE